VLLHMVAPFREWLAESQGVIFEMRSSDFAQSMRRADSGEMLDKLEIWGLLGAFFESEMSRQTPIAGAVEGLRELADRADVVVLTNIPDSHRERRQAQLTSHGIAARVYTNQGPKGPALERIVAEFRPSHTVFIDDLPQHHASARQVLGDLTTLHLCGEPLLAPHIACAHAAGHADARIDNWAEALPWLLARLDQIAQKEGEPA
jgi:FMN phosphatase YigB (HAD superfamily)